MARSPQDGATRDGNTTVQKPDQGQYGANNLSGRQGSPPKPNSLKARVVRRFKPLANFWIKINNDWILNLAGLLAYNFLMSIFPILLVLLAVAGFLLNGMPAASRQQLASSIANTLPSRTGSALVNTTLHNLSKTAGLVLVVGVITSAFTGSRLFITMENCFGIIYRLRGRGVVRQNIMAFEMLGAFVIAAPLLVLASTVPTIITKGGNGLVSGIFAGFGAQLAGIVAGFLVAFVLFGLIYVIVPNRPVNWHEVWKGSLLAAILFAVYEVIFPIYEAHFLQLSNYGSLAGFAVVILTFFYYLAIVLLVGAEFNSWQLGQRETATDLAGMIHEVQAHNTTRGAAGPTAGTIAEDVQDRKGSDAMATPAAAVVHEREDHRGDFQPPKYAEAGDPGPKPLQPQTDAMRQRTKAAEKSTQKHDEQIEKEKKEGKDDDTPHHPGAKNPPNPPADHKQRGPRRVVAPAEHQPLPKVAASLAAKLVLDRLRQRLGGGNRRATS